VVEAQEAQQVAQMQAQQQVMTIMTGIIICRTEQVS